MSRTDRETELLEGHRANVEFLLEKLLGKRDSSILKRVKPLGMLF